MGFRWVPKLVTLNDLERRNGRIVCGNSKFASLLCSLRKSGWRYACEWNAAQRI